MKFDDLKELGSESAVKVCVLNKTLFGVWGVVNDNFHISIYSLGNYLESELDRLIGKRRD
jgi:hypothetical protein